LEQHTKVERRRHPRIYPDRKTQPKVSFSLNNHEKIKIEVVNISQGGILGYTSKTKDFIGSNHKKLEEIEIAFPGEKTFHCSGKILRVQPSRESHKFFCALQFSEIGFDENDNLLNVGERIEHALRPIEETIIPDQQLITRVEKTENYMKSTDPKLKAELQKNVYDAFDDITAKLSLEEKWWFFEIIDEMKRHEPDYPEELKRAFVNLCRVGLKHSLKEP